MEESAPTVIHESISRPRTGRNRKKQECVYVVGPSTTKLTDSADEFARPPLMVSSAREVPNPEFTNDGFPLYSDSPSEFPSSDGPQLFNGLLDPNDDGAQNNNDDRGSVIGEEEHLHKEDEEHIHQMRSKGAPERRIRVS